MLLPAICLCRLQTVSAVFLGVEQCWSNLLGVLHSILGVALTM